MMLISFFNRAVIVMFLYSVTFASAATRVIHADVMVDGKRVSQEIRFQGIIFAHCMTRLLQVNHPHPRVADNDGDEGIEDH
ncbi:hypothetical protein CROQUDRAFT_393288 [Cronartium quercuum f. sp. fusiforme G11]|uniref:Uncharacterized protein n=1 Tax=Cronartium quercuum f. sp. fusiforme G11 TaxID=708437 RepID=A0A9P6NSA9_9BASI|nr:hypothetical protein CROQUDRAFT_393288 [Cronartium quercuum f. sp. fusiforme G11]